MLASLLPILLIFIIGLIIAWFNIRQQVANRGGIAYGVTFSPSYAKYLKLDWKEVYQKTLTDLNVKYLRLPTYWPDIEPTPQKFDFSQTDYLLDQAGKHSAKVLLVIGIKQPRWPECHVPEWAKTLSHEQRRKAALNYMHQVVDRYKNYPQIWGWQVENEPLLSFGESCDPASRSELQDEVAQVRSWDSSRSIVVTDSGEWRPWITPMKLSDIFGTSVYRKAYFPFFGYFSYPFPPLMYDLKSLLVKFFFAPNNQKTIISELQTEPWLQKGVQETDISFQQQVFSPKDFIQAIDFTAKVSFDESYLWGVEWWYWMAKQGHPEYWNIAKNLFQNK